jgi:hypothetical protein
MTRLAWARRSAIVLFTLLSFPAFAASPFAEARRAAAVRIASSEAPFVDGDLGDPVWAKATVLDEFRQREPNPGAPATERTVLRILYDENNLHFSVHAYDSMPDQVAVRAMSRDGPLYTGDFVTIVLDPGLTRRNAYAFQVGPSGGRNDTLYLNNADDLDQWDAIWQARARRTADGWVAEIAIPFRSLSYEGDGGDWGFEFTREIRRKNEEIRWSSINPALEGSDVSQAGTLSGITDIQRGIGLDVQLYGVTRMKRDWRTPGADTAVEITGGGNAFYKITPALTGTLTVNPDFSDAPLDLRLVNTSRFSLFYPETRDFFLQDAASFEFGGLNFSGNDRDTNNGRPFFTRNIGLINGMPVSIVAGGKLSGQYGGFDIGALTALTDRSPGTDRQLLSALRMTRPVFGESKLGFVFTNGDPAGRDSNSVAGADFQYRNSNMFGGAVLIADMFYQRSFSSRLPDDDSYGAAIEFPNEPWGGSLRFKEIGTHFEPALGFVNRPAIRLYEGNLGYLIRFRDSFLRSAGFETENRLFTDLHGRLESRDSQFSFEVEADSADEFQLSLVDVYEDVPAAFDLPRNIVVPSGRYGWTNFSLSLETSEARVLAAEIELVCCGFYNGRAVELSANLSYRPNEYFEFSPGYEGNFIELPGGSVDIHVLSAASTVNFTPDMQVALQAQYDNISKDIGFLARYRWEYQPGSELFAALGQSALVPHGRPLAQSTQFSLRLGHTFRF